MKTIYFILLAVFALNFAFTACSEEDPFSTATSSDEPRILDPIFPDRVNGELPVISTISRDANLTMTLTVTPADYTNVVWLIDGNEVQTGTELDINLNAGTYNFKVIVSTSEGKSTYREGLVQVNPLAGDPWATEVGLERIITSNITARLYGENLSSVTGLMIDGISITNINYIEAEDNNYIEYEVPDEIQEGEHRVVLLDAKGNEYGGNPVTVTNASLITSGATRTNANREWLMSGLNLDQIASMTINGEVITEFTQQSTTEIAFICPAFEDGDYILVGKTVNGEDVKFYNSEVIAMEQTVTVSSTTVLWEGHHYVSWDLADDNPNKTFNLIGADVFATLKAGAVLSINYSVAPEAEYHQLRTTSGWWNDLPGTSAIDFSENGVKEVVLTQEVLDKIQAEAGFLCVGHGFYVDMISVQ